MIGAEYGSRGIGHGPFLRDTQALWKGVTLALLAFSARENQNKVSRKDAEIAKNGAEMRDVSSLSEQYLGALGVLRENKTVSSIGAYRAANMDPIESLRHE
jgi:hypothetical protein